MNGTKNALLKYSENLLKANEKQPTGRKNNKPEEEVNSNLRNWFKANGWSMGRVESKGVYSERHQTYILSETEKYTSDWVGCSPQGLGAFIEAKAEGKRSTLSEGQRGYLTEKINCGAFAVCVDGVDNLVDHVEKFSKCVGRAERIRLLLDLLPKPPKSRGGDLSFFD
jgi:hypothetical protein